MDTTQKRVSTPMLAGCGILRAKPTPHAMVREGKISIPHLGQCFIDGHHSALVKDFVVDIVQRIAGVRTKVGELQLPMSRATVIEGRVTTLRGETYKCVASLRHSDFGSYRALRLPDVKIAQEERDAAFGTAPAAKYAAV